MYQRHIIFLTVAILLFICAKSYGQKRYLDIKMLTNSSFKYWDAVKGVSWRLGINGELDAYYFDKYNNREQPHNSDVVIRNHMWAIKGDTLFELALPSIIGEYKIIKLKNDSMVLKSIVGVNGTDTLLFLSSKDQKKTISKLHFE